MIACVRLSGASSYKLAFFTVTMISDVVKFTVFAHKHAIIITTLFKNIFKDSHTASKVNSFMEKKK